jgi:CelD/BcsL family acetyltransferase involved in cellulose biosynthesis
MTHAVTVLRGDEAHDALDDPAFLEGWERLRAACPWATAFQSAPFATAWYRAYRHRWEPVLAVRSGADGRPDGLLAMGAGRDGSVLTSAGGHQAEYHAWIAPPDDTTFGPAALAALERVFPGRAIALRYVPPGVPLASIVDAEGLGARAEAVLHRRPLMRLNPATIEQSLGKKGNRSRLNRLARAGRIRFERLTTPEALDHVFDAVIAQYDLRQGAVNDVLPFRSDAMKRAFHLALMEVPGLLHVTVLWAGEELLAAHLGVADSHTVHWGIGSHSPFHARHSPGKLHVLLLARLLADEGIAVLDLTPGGDPWKERFSNEHDTVRELTVHPTAAALTAVRRRRRLRGAAKAAARAVGIDPAAARRTATAGVRRLANGVRAVSAVPLYRRSLPAAVTRPEPEPLRRDRIEDLLAAADRAARREALADALRRLEDGAHLYTSADGQGAPSWLLATPAPIGASGARFAAPEPGAVLYDATRCVSDGAAFDGQLRQILADAPSTAPCLYVALPKHGEQLARRLAAHGFTRCGTVRARRTVAAPWFRAAGDP